MSQDAEILDLERLVLTGDASALVRLRAAWRRADLASDSRVAQVESVARRREEMFRAEANKAAEYAMTVSKDADARVARVKRDAVSAVAKALGLKVVVDD